MRKEIIVFWVLQLIFFAFIPNLKAQYDHIEGTVVSSHGNFYNVTNTDYTTDTNTVFKVVFDIGKQFADSSQINPLLNTPARYLNMHAHNGVPLENMKIAVVIHGNASFDVLNDLNYLSKYKIKNPNTLLLQELHEAGAEIIICGQSATYKKIYKEDLNANVKMALSAMTALVQLQKDGYQLIAF